MAVGPNFDEREGAFCLQFVKTEIDWVRKEKEESIKKRDAPSRPLRRVPREEKERRD